MLTINNPIQFNLLDSEYNNTDSDKDLDDITPIVIPENPPWLNPKPIFYFDLTQYKTILNKPFTNSATFC
jgi:hypothetical protein